MFSSILSLCIFTLSSSWSATNLRSSSRYRAKKGISSGESSKVRLVRDCPFEDLFLESPGFLHKHNFTPLQIVPISVMILSVITLLFGGTSSRL